MNLQKMAQQVAKLKDEAAKKRQVHLLCASLMAMLKSGVRESGV